MRRAGFWVLVLAVSALGAYSAYVVVMGAIKGSRGSDPGIYWPALGLIALVAITCGMLVRRLLKRGAIRQPRGRGDDGSRSR